MLEVESAPDRPLPRDVARSLIPSKPTGNQSQLTDEVAEGIVSAVAQGSFLTAAAGKMGVDVRTASDWLRRGLGDKEAGLDTMYSRLADAYARAQSEAEAAMVATLSKGGEGKYPDWRAQAFVLERRFKDRWSLPKEQTNQGLTLQLSNEQVASLVEALRVAKATDVTPAVLTIDSTTIGSGNK